MNTEVTAATEATTAPQEGIVAGDGAVSAILLVEQCVVVELKTVRALMSVHHAQLLSYLRLSKMPTGLLINFHVARLQDGIKRIAN